MSAGQRSGEPTCFEIGSECQNELSLNCLSKKLENCSTFLMRSRFLNKIIRRLQTLRGLGEGFTEAGFHQRERFRKDYQVLANVILDQIEFNSVFDVGCANGFLLEGFMAAGKRVGGIELSPDVRFILSPELNLCVEVGDFSGAKGRWDLVTCVEVAEHIPPLRSEDLVDTLCRLATDRILFSAALPGQKGHGHINCRPKSDWLNWFETRGWVLSDIQTKKIQDTSSSVTEATWLVGNIFVLQRT